MTAAATVNEGDGIGDGDGVRRIAMWSGPRNISTAMMRSFGNRADTAVADEPFYAVYLAATGIDHPGRDRILAAMPTDWRRVVADLTGPVPGGARVFYQKHMTHHLVAEIGLDWLHGLTHAFLIRRPAAMLASYLDRRGSVTLADTGLPQQIDLFRRIADATGKAPPVVDADAILADPEAMLRALCRALDLSFDPAMLRWPPGRRDSDGVWAEHWYASVEKSTGFAPPRHDTPYPDLPAALGGLLAQCEAIHAELAAHALMPDNVVPGS